MDHMSARSLSSVLSWFNGVGVMLKWCHEIQRYEVFRLICIRILFSGIFFFVFSVTLYIASI